MNPLTDQQLTPAEIRLAQYGQRTSTWSTATYNDGTEKALHEIALGLKAEVDRLRDALAREERLHGDTIDDRDRIHEAADKLAYAVAPIEVIGEHSSMNDPWENALDHLTPAAEVAKLRARVTELERPSVEAKRNEIRQSYAELIAQCEQDRDYEGAFDVQCRLRDREEQWKREDAAPVSA